MRRVLVLLAAVLCAALPASRADAHEVRPAYLQVRRDASAYHILWKRPVQGDMAVRLEPHLSNGWLDRPPGEQLAGGSYLAQAWTIPDRRPDALEGVTLRVDGLERTITDVIVHVDLPDGRSSDEMLRPDRPSLTFRLAEPHGLPVLQYLTLGVTHILTGADHLSFVLGLLLLIGPSWRLLKAVTAFTAAHSLTLALAALHLLRPPSALIEGLVALSILFLAAELVRARRGGDSLTVRSPWIIAFAFGLLHGCAFAGALQEVGLPPDAVPQALFLFNLGVEAGQLLFIAAAMGVGWAAVRLVRALPARPAAWVRGAPAYGIGAVSAFWVLERLVPVIA